MEQRRTFRLSGIPQGSGEERVQQLSRLAFGWGQDIQVYLRSLANDPVIPEEMVATLEFPVLPKTLRDMLGHREVTGVLEATTVFLDTHFYEFTPLSSPDMDNWEIDVVALSGLNGHAFGSFKRKQESFMWLRDALPKECPQARVLIYGYDTQMVDSMSFQNLLDLGETFRSGLRTVRRGVNKPLILIGHSLGGLIVKEAVHLLATSSVNEDRTIFKSLAGLLFFGVPSQGMDITTLIPMVDGQPNQDLLRNLGQNSPVLRRQTEAFITATAQGKFDIVYFFETMLSPTAEQQMDGLWKMSGKPALLVAPESAKQGTSQEARIYHSPVNTTHSDLVKFPNRHCSPYQTVCWHIRRLSHFLDNSDQEDQEKCSKKKEEQNEKLKKECLQSLAFKEQFEREDMLEAAPGTCNWIFDHQDFISWTNSTRGILWIKGNPGTGKSTMMKKILDRKTEETELNNGHCVASYFIHGRGSALQKTPVGLYRSLLHQLYSKIPGAFHQLEQIYQKRSSEAGQHGDKWCWLLGDLKRALFSGVAEVWADVSIVIMIDALDEAGEQQATVIVDHLNEIFEKSVRFNGRVQICFSCRHYPTIILNGGATICMEHHNADDINKFLETRVDKVSLIATPQRKELVAYISSRSNGTFQWAVLVLAKARHLSTTGASFAFILESIQETPTDLHELYHSLLRELEEPLQTLKLFHWLLFSETPLYGLQIQHILALDHDIPRTSICNYNNGKHPTEFSHVENAVIYLSKGLAKITLARYMTIAQFIGEGDRVLTSKIIRCTPLEGQVSFIHQSVVEYLLNGGLAAIETIKSVPCSEIAHFQISRCCLQYLVMDKIEHYAKWIDQLGVGCLGDISDQLEENGHSENAMFHDKALSAGETSMKDIPNDNFQVRDRTKKNRVRDELYNRLPLLKYAWRYWIMHHRKAGIILSRGNVDLLNIFSWPKHDHSLLNTWSKIATATGTSPSLGNMDVMRPGQEWLCGGLRLPHLLAIVGSWSSTLDAMLASDMSIDAKDERGETPLSYAVRLGRPTMVRDILKSNTVKADHQTRYGGSLLHLALNDDNRAILNSALDVRIESDIHDIVESLVRVSSPLEVKDGYGRTALSYAAGSGYLKTLDLLLQSGANADSRDFLGQTPLFYAAKRGHLSVVRCLIRHEARVNAKDLFGRTPLQYAADNRRAYTVLVLLDAYSASSGQRSDGAFSALCHSWRETKSAEEVLVWLKMVRQKKRPQGTSVRESSQDGIISDGLQYIQQIAKRQRVR